MATFVPSKYQKTVYTYITRGKGNAVIDAVAGSGKSTTIVNALKIIPANKQILFLAFNASIVQELKIKIGNLPNVEVRTLHSLGMKAMVKAFKSQVDENKYTAWLNSGIQSGFIRPYSNLGDRQGLPVVGHTTGIDKYDLKSGWPGLAIDFERGKIHIPIGDKYSQDVKDLIFSDLGSVAFTDKGLESVGEHDDISSSFWLAKLAANLITTGFRYTFLG